MNIIWLNSGWFKVKYNIKKLVVDTNFALKNR